MANEEHLKILQQGVEAWNQWRQNNEEIEPDLSEASLSNAYLIGANLKGADLRKTNLYRAILRGADLRKTNLKGANLSYVNLSKANLRGANLKEANLTKTILSGTDLRGANLTKTDLSGRDFTKQDLRGAILSGAILNGVILSETDLSETDISGATLHETDLSEAILNGAILSKTDLSRRDFTEKDLNGVCFQNANLQRACLINADLDGANLTDARLWETQRAGWSIKGIICASAYWDEKAEKKSIYAEGEFEKLFADLAKIQLSYKGGISLLEIATLPSLIQHLANIFPDCSLRFVSIHEDAGGKVVELAIEDVDDLSKEQIKQLQGALEKEAQQQVELQRKALKEREKRLELEGEVKQLSIVVDKLINRPTFNGDTYNVSGQAGAVGPNAHAHHNTFNQLVNQMEQSIDLAALAKELYELRQAIKDKKDSSPQADIALVKVAEAEIAASEKNTPKVIEYLKAAGKWALDFAKEIGKDVVAEAIKQSMQMP